MCLNKNFEIENKEDYLAKQTFTFQSDTKSCQINPAKIEIEKIRNLSLKVLILRCLVYNLRISEKTLAL